jgi:hypothetical protein
LKIRRKVIAQKNKDNIDAMYEGGLKKPEDPLVKKDPRSFLKTFPSIQTKIGAHILPEGIVRRYYNRYARFPFGRINTHHLALEGNRGGWWSVRKWAGP